MEAYGGMTAMTRLHAALTGRLLCRGTFGWCVLNRPIPSTVIHGGKWLGCNRRPIVTTLQRSVRTHQAGYVTQLSEGSMHLCVAADGKRFTNQTGLRESLQVKKGHVVGDTILLSVGLSNVHPGQDIHMYGQPDLRSSMD